MTLQQLMKKALVYILLSLLALALTYLMPENWLKAAVNFALSWKGFFVCAFIIAMIADKNTVSDLEVSKK